nr:hypothetical protein [uncultured Lachnoclostridium sp.]
MPRDVIARSNEAKVSGKLARTENIMDETMVLGSQDTVVLMVMEERLQLLVQAL